MAPPPRKVLLFVSGETGQYNVFVATTLALFEQDPTIQVHIASWEGLEPVAKKEFAHIPSDRFTFHLMPGPTFNKACNRNPDPEKNMFGVALLKPNLFNTLKALRFFGAHISYLYTAPEFAAMFHKTQALIEDFKPDVVLSDPMLNPVLTAMKHVRATSTQHRAFWVGAIIPNSLKDMLAHLEPTSAPLTKWPMACSAIPMPMAWYWVPLNIIFVIAMVLIPKTDKFCAARLAEYRTELGMPDLDVSGFAAILTRQLHGMDRVFVGGRPEVDFPDIDYEGPPKSYTERIEACGPIMRATPPLAEVDPDLAAWMRAGPVVYVNLGTMCRVSRDEAVEMARVVKKLFDEARSRKIPGGDQMRLLWKLKKDPSRGPEYTTDPGSEVYEVLKAEYEEGRIKIVDWVTAEPMAILATGDVVTAVTHGGANSYYECVVNGVAQVVLPVWVDCYDFANRAEILGIGRWGNVKECPRWSLAELAPIMIDVVMDRNAKYTAKSRQLAKICEEAGEGRDIAARKVIEFIDKRPERQGQQTNGHVNGEIKA